MQKVAQKTQAFVPTPVFKKLTLPKRGALSAGPERIVQTEQGFYVKGRALSGPDQGLAFAAKAGMSMVGACVDKKKLYAITSYEDPAAVLITHHVLEGEETVSEKFTSMTRTAEEVLTRLAAQTGYKFLLHFRQSRVCNPFDETDPETFHIIVGASPPGQVQTADCQQKCGVRLHPKGYWAHCNAPTYGRGYIFKDEMDEPVGQILGQNIYLFTPALTRDTVPVFSFEGSNLLLKMLQLVSKTLAEGIPKQEEKVLDSGASFEAFTRTRFDKLKGEIHRLIEKQDREMHEAQRKYANAMNERRQYVAFREHFDRLLDEGAYRNCQGDWRRMKNNPLVEQLSVNDEALHLTTKRVVAKEAGKRYDFGSFVIRMRLGGEVSVWSTAPTHPRGIAHPHISDRSSLCFGNAGIEIERASGELRFADAIELVLEWLVSGYDPKLADVKIEEWPLFTLKEAA